MKVLQINSVCGIKSTGRICTDLAEILELKSHECRIAYGRETVPDKYKKYAVRIGTNTDVIWHALLSRIFDNSGFGSKEATKKFIEWANKYDPDVVHLHNIHGYYINIEVLFKYLAEARKPVVWTMHDCWAITGHCTHFMVKKCNKWKTMCYSCPETKKYPSSFVFDRSKQNYEHKKKLFTSVKKMTLVSPSKWLANILQESFLSNYDIKVINNGIDLNVFKPTENDIKSKYFLGEKKLVLSVASMWGQRKGFEDLQRLAEILGDQYQVVLIGVPKKLMEALKSQVIGITRTNDLTELAQWYSAADVFVNATYEDNFPTVNIEALACGTPVVTYKTGGSIEAAGNEYGITVPTGDIFSLANAVRRCISRDIPEKKYTERAKLFDKKNRFYDYICLYNKLTNNNMR